MRRAQRSGFTLIELVVVVTLIAMIMAVALPQFLSVVSSRGVRRNADHFATYGRSAMGAAALSGESLIIKIDFDAQEYWCERWLPVSEGDDLFNDDAGMFKESGLFEGTGNEGAAAAEDMQEKVQAMQERFARFVRANMEARARNVKRDDEDELFDETGPLFEDEFDLDENSDEERETEEVSDPLLTRTKLPEGVVIESVIYGGETKRSGVVEVDVTPLGLGQFVTVYFRGGPSEYYTVEWDPITRNSLVQEGKKVSEQAREEAS